MDAQTIYILKMKKAKILFILCASCWIICSVMVFIALFILHKLALFGTFFILMWIFAFLNFPAEINYINHKKLKQ